VLAAPSTFQKWDEVHLNGDREIRTLTIDPSVIPQKHMMIDGGRGPDSWNPSTSDTLTITEGVIDDYSGGFVHVSSLIKFGTSTATIHRDAAVTNRDMSLSGIEMGDSDLLVKTGTGLLVSFADNYDRFSADIRVEGGKLNMGSTNNAAGFGDGLKSDGVTPQTVTLMSGTRFDYGNGNGTFHHAFEMEAGSTVQASTGRMTIAGPISGDGTLLREGGGGAPSAISGDASEFQGQVIARTGGWEISNKLGTGDITIDAASQNLELNLLPGAVVQFETGEMISAINTGSNLVDITLAPGSFDLTKLDRGLASQVLLDYSDPNVSVSYTGSVLDLRNPNSDWTGLHLVDTGTQIIAVPEPATLAMLGLAPLVALRRRR